MSDVRAVSCPRCGASTPLPDDLRTETFACRFCGGVLETATFAGKAAVSADALLGHMQTAVQSSASPLEMARSAPRFEGGSSATRSAACLACGAEVQVPLDLTIHQLACAACGKVQAVSAYISDVGRLQIDMARQVAGNEALKKLRADGAPCTKCGGLNPLPADASVQFACGFCGSTVLLAEHVDPTAVARQRLAQGVFAMRDQMVRDQQARERTERRVVAIGIALVFVGIVAANLIFGR